jgi:uncharacterized membrane protein YgcG
MGVFRAVLGLVTAIGFLMKLVIGSIMTIVGWFVVQDMVHSGQLPSEPLGLAAMGAPETLFGIPTVYAGGILLIAWLLLFGDSGSSSGIDDGFADGDGGGFGDGGGGDGGGGGGGDGGE